MPDSESADSSNVVNSADQSLRWLQRLVGEISLPEHTLAEQMALWLAATRRGSKVSAEFFTQPGVFEQVKERYRRVLLMLLGLGCGFLEEMEEVGAEKLATLEGLFGAGRIEAAVKKLEVQYQAKFIDFDGASRAAMEEVLQKLEEPEKE